MPQLQRQKVCEKYHKVELRQAIFSGFAVPDGPCYERTAMRRAVIDIGTNTVKVLVSDVQQGQVVTVMHKDRVTRLGEGVHDCRQLSPEAIARTLEAIDQFHAEANAAGAVHII